MDNLPSPKEILESYREITIEKQINDGVFLINLFDKNFLLICPVRDKPESHPFVYLANDEGFDFPHVVLLGEEVNESLPEGKYRLVCLYEHESVVYSVIPYEEKIADAINRLIELLSLTPVEREKEFQKEFLHYWNDAARNKVVNKVYLSQESHFSRMSVYCSKSDIRYIESGLELSDLNVIEKNEHKWLQHVENDTYFVPIMDTREILPPYVGHPWTTDTIRDIVCGKQIAHISHETYQSICDEKVSTKDVILIFGMKDKQSDVTFAVKLNCKNNRSGRTLIEKICNDILDVEPIITERKDYSYLSDQIGNDIGLRGKKVLLIGGGSLGSYIAFELVKNGVASLKVYDEDQLSDENILRWAYLGFGKGTNKASLLKFHLEYLHPEIRVEAIDKNIDAKTLVEESAQVDMIVFTIGSSDSQLVFNRILKEISCHIPVIFTWLEAGGKYSHILTIDYTKRGCYECLYTNEQGERINNKSSLRNNDDLDVSIIRNGCGGTRAAYGSAILLRTTAALLGTIQKIFSGELNENTLIDITPESITSSSQAIPMEACRCCGN